MQLEEVKNFSLLTECNNIIQITSPKLLFVTESNDIVWPNQTISYEITLPKLYSVIEFYDVVWSIQ